MRNKSTLDFNWIQKTFRIRKEVIKIYKYLEFHAIKNDISKDILFDNIVNFSMDYINTYKPKISITKFDELRDVKGFTLQEETYSDLQKFYDNNFNHFLVAEFIECLIGIYSVKTLSQPEIKDNGLNTNFLSLSF